MWRSVVFWSMSSWRWASSAPTVAVALLLLEVVGGVAAEVADLDARLFHALVDDLDEVLATFLGQRRDVQADDRAVDVRASGRCRSW